MKHLVSECCVFVAHHWSLVCPRLYLWLFIRNIHGFWWTGDARIEDISNYGTDLVLPGYGFRTTGVKLQQNIVVYQVLEYLIHYESGISPGYQSFPVNRPQHLGIQLYQYVVAGIITTKALTPSTLLCRSNMDPYLIEFQCAHIHEIGIDNVNYDVIPLTKTKLCLNKKYYDIPFISFDWLTSSQQLVIFNYARTRTNTQLYIWMCLYLRVFLTAGFQRYASAMACFVNSLRPRDAYMRR